MTTIYDDVHAERVRAHAKHGLTSTESADPRRRATSGRWAVGEIRCECCDLPAYSCGKAAEQRQRDELAEAHLLSSGSTARRRSAWRSTSGP